MGYLSTSYEEILFQRKNKFDIYIFIIKKIEKKLSGKKPAKDKNKNAYYWYM